MSYLDHLVHVHATGPLDKSNGYGAGLVHSTESFQVRVENAARRPHVWPLLRDGFNFAIAAADIRPFRALLIDFLEIGVMQGCLPSGNAIGVMPRSVNVFVSSGDYDRTAIQVVQKEGFSPIVRLPGIDSLCLRRLIFVKDGAALPQAEILPILEGLRKGSMAQPEHASRDEALLRAIQSAT